jgi:selenide,water dikinase
MPRLVLAGLGHAHLFVLEAARQGHLPPCEVVVCTGEREHPYSGMVPGWVGGRYRREELAIPVAALVAQAGATLRPHHVVGVDRTTREVLLTDGSHEPYDLCSIATGSMPSGLHLPGVREHAFPLKPLSGVVEVMSRAAELAAAGTGKVVMVGGGGAGVEVACNLATRLRQLNHRHGVSITIVSRDPRPAMDRSPATQRLVERALARQGIRFLGAQDVQGVDASSVQLATESLPSDLTIWATGAAAPAWFAATGLPRDERGFLLVNGALQSLGDDQVLAAGDAATPADARGTPKAGVYAVRMGPRLVGTLRALLSGQTPDRSWRPQRRFLALLSTGDDRAIASWGAFAVEGRWAMTLKDRIDRRFLERFSVGR